MTEKQYISEPEAAKKIGVSNQTLGNWRRGYVQGGTTVEPKLRQGKQWIPLGGFVMYDKAWVESLAAVERMREELLS